MFGKILFQKYALPFINVLISLLKNKTNCILDGTVNFNWLDSQENALFVQNLTNEY